MTPDGLNANHIPFLLQTAPAPYGCLQGHAPRANPLTSSLVEDVEVLAIFHGPEGYISPSWYPLKQETGKVVPTWNYRVVHAYGRLQVIDDPAWVRAQVEALTTMNEARFDNPWQVSDAPRDFTDKMIGALLGLEIVITRLLGKTKAN
jgi:transcriptional regulator